MRVPIYTVKISIMSFLNLQQIEQDSWKNVKTTGATIILKKQRKKEKNKQEE